MKKAWFSCLDFEVTTYSVEEIATTITITDSGKLDDFPSLLQTGISKTSIAPMCSFAFYWILAAGRHWRTAAGYGRTKSISMKNGRERDHLFTGHYAFFTHRERVLWNRAIPTHEQSLLCIMIRRLDFKALAMTEDGVNYTAGLTGCAASQLMEQPIQHRR